MVFQKIQTLGGEYSSEFFVGGGEGCRPFLQILTCAARLSKSCAYIFRPCHFPYPFADPAFKNCTRFANPFPCPDEVNI